MTTRDRVSTVPSRGMHGELDDPIDPVQLGQHVGDDHDGLAFLAPPIDVIPEVDVGPSVESLVWLVEQQHLGVAEQRQGEVQLLLRPTREVPRRQPLIGGEAKAPQDGTSVRQGLLATEPHGPSEQDHVLRGRQELEDAWFLRAVPHPSCHPNLAGIY